MGSEKHTLLCRENVRFGCKAFRQKIFQAAPELPANKPDAAQRYRAQSGRGQIFLQFGWYHGAFYTVFVPLLGAEAVFVLAPVIKISRPEEDARNHEERYSYAMDRFE